MSSQRFITSFRDVFRKRNFGKFSVVWPGCVSSSLPVPDHIPKPNYYITGTPDQPPDTPEIKTREKIDKMRKSCYLAASALKHIEKYVKVGITTEELDEIAHNFIIKNNAYPSPLNYLNFPKSICTSVNNVACHGIPDDRPLFDGDIINIDITVFLNGFHGDCSKTFLVGEVDDLGKELVNATEKCLKAGIDVCGPGRNFSDIGTAIEAKAKELNYRVIPDFIGHGIGEYFHGPPDILHFRNNYAGAMEPGMTFTIEPILSQGSNIVEQLDDNWTIITEDNSRTAQCEHTVLITENGTEILTVIEQ